MAVEYVWTGSPDIDAAIPLLRLGRLNRFVHESLVIDSDVCGVVLGSATMSYPALPTVMRQQRPQAPIAADDDLASDVGGDCCHDQDERSFVAIDEGDLLVEDFDDVEDPAMAACGPSHDDGWFAPGSATPLHLMRARAQQCVVCLQDKAHTFVPPHSGGGCARDVSGHRFCTDCWIEFLYHSSRQQRCGARPAPLACPLCRGGIHVPDVWGATYVLPSVWMQPAADEEEEALGPLSEPAMVEEAEQLTLWAGCARRGQGRGGRDQSDHA
mmetsp:Transcript_98086/g.274568  ORF Transcript_98086/g.274568 Transcript_98086/m.274568 type:complete len:270 (+) Transcript_98086:70-879(+)